MSKRTLGSLIGVNAFILAGGITAMGVALGSNQNESQGRKVQFDDLRVGDLVEKIIFNGNLYTAPGSNITFSRVIVNDLVTGAGDYRLYNDDGATIFDNKNEKGVPTLFDGSDFYDYDDEFVNFSAKTHTLMFKTDVGIMSVPTNGGSDILTTASYYLK